MEQHFREIIEKIGKGGKIRKIIRLSAGHPYENVEILEIGIDYLIIKSYDNSEIILRIDAIESIEIKK